MSSSAAGRRGLLRRLLGAASSAFDLSAGLFLPISPMRSHFHAATFKPLHAVLAGSQLQLEPTLNIDTIALRDRQLGGVRVAFFLPFAPCAKGPETRDVCADKKSSRN